MTMTILCRHITKTRITETIIQWKQNTMIFSRQRRRQILRFRSPNTLMPPKNNHQIPSLGEEIMPNPVAGVILAIKSSRLNKPSASSVIRGIELIPIVNANGSRFTGYRRDKSNSLEEWHCD